MSILSSASFGFCASVFLCMFLHSILLFFFLSIAFFFFSFWFSFFLFLAFFPFSSSIFFLFRSFVWIFFISLSVCLMTTTFVWYAKTVCIPNGNRINRCQCGIIVCWLCVPKYLKKKFIMFKQNKTHKIPNIHMTLDQRENKTKTIHNQMNRSEAKEEEEEAASAAEIHVLRKRSIHSSQRIETTTFFSSSRFCCCCCCYFRFLQSHFGLNARRAWNTCNYTKCDSQCESTPKKRKEYWCD